jgi:hypothetical protein
MVSLFSFFQQTPNLKSFEVNFLRPFFRDAHTKPTALPKYHQELYEGSKSNLDGHSKRKLVSSQSMTPYRLLVFNTPTGRAAGALV